jgi:hypothetical protein
MQKPKKQQLETRNGDLERKVKETLTSVTCSRYESGPSSIVPPSK